LPALENFRRKIFRKSRFQLSKIKVTGPSLISSTSIKVLNLPVSVFKPDFSIWRTNSS